MTPSGDATPAQLTPLPQPAGTGRPAEGRAHSGPAARTELVLLARVRLRLRAPAAITATERLAAAPDDPLAAATALPVARDGWGEDLYIPAASLAGAFRAHLHTTAPHTVTTLMGSPPGPPGQSPDQIVPSALRFLGTRITPADPAPQAPARPVTERRGRTAIDRRRGAAATGTLRAHELLPSGTTITVYLRLDGGDTDLHSRLLHALATWAPHVGGGRSIGWGQADTEQIRHGTLDLATPAGLTHWLTLGGPDLIDTVATTDHTPAPLGREPWLTVPWYIVDPLHIGAGDTGRRPGPDAGRSAAPAALARSGGIPLVPGSTWKGLLRARCEYILRSTGLLDTAETPDCDSSRAGGTCGRCVLCDAFGWTAPPGHTLQGTHAEAADAPVAVRGRLDFADSPIDHAEITIRNHVGLDRVFGGAADGLLFATEVAETGTLTLTIGDDPHRPLADPDLTKALIVLACHDIHDGHLGIGAATTRGHGTLALTHPEAADLDRETAVLTLLDRHQQGPQAIHPTRPETAADDDR